MERLKPLTEICSPDVRTHMFGILDLEAPGGFRQRTVNDFHRAASAIQLNNTVPEHIRSHFETARNLILYSWFFYPFNVTAELSAYITVEYALRERTGDRKTQFAKLLQRAVDVGWITDSKFSIPTQRLEGVRGRNEGLPPEFQQPEPTLNQEYSDALARSIPFLRNRLAHGSNMLHNTGAGTVSICAELINQLYPDPNSKP